MNGMANDTLTTLLKRDLWRTYGSEEHPAEWDGRVYGGGKLSQRLWEYLITIEYLDLDESSVVLDIGGGSPTTGCGFLSDILRRHVERVVILDANVEQAKNSFENVELIASEANPDSLKEVLSRGEITHVACVSVLEHVESEARRDLIAAIDEHFTGHTFAGTYEYHPLRSFFRYQLTTHTASEMFSAFRRFHLEAYSSSPTLCENALKALPLSFLHRVLVPRWYPVAVKFVRSPE